MTSHLSRELSAISWNSATVFSNSLPVISEMMFSFIATVRIGGFPPDLCIIPRSLYAPTHLTNDFLDNPYDLAKFAAVSPNRIISLTNHNFSTSLGGILQKFLALIRHGRRVLFSIFRCITIGCCVRVRKVVMVGVTA